MSEAFLTTKTIEFSFLGLMMVLDYLSIFKILGLVSGYFYASFLSLIITLLQVEAL